MPTYNKLVRNRIPAVIGGPIKNLTSHALTNNEYSNIITIKTVEGVRLDKMKKCSGFDKRTFLIGVKDD
ncbi:hypothetical protein [Sporosarcina sp. FSL K6-5500]|uniref:hypothetical protein n=1 Tax=Sporosarcina sp. FSL K6-5500 TaxID=2921558 RepID=UPI0030F6C649